MEPTEEMRQKDEEIKRLKALEHGRTLLPELIDMERRALKAEAVCYALRAELRSRTLEHVKIRKRVEAERDALKAENARLHMRGRIDRLKGQGR